MDMIWHKMSFYYLYPFIRALLLEYVSDICFQLIVYYLSSILWGEDDVIFTHPLRMCEGIFFFRHLITFPFRNIA